MRIFLVGYKERPRLRATKDGAPLIDALKNLPTTALLIISPNSPNKALQHLAETGWEEVPVADLAELYDRIEELAMNRQNLWYRTTSIGGGKARLFTRWTPVPPPILEGAMEA